MTRRTLASDFDRVLYAPATGYVLAFLLGVAVTAYGLGR